MDLVQEIVELVFNGKPNKEKVLVRRTNELLIETKKLAKRKAKQKLNIAQTDVYLGLDKTDTLAVRKEVLAALKVSSIPHTLFLLAVKEKTGQMSYGIRVMLK